MAGINPPVPPGQAWTSFSVEIIPENFTLHAIEGWGDTFESVMASVNSIHLRGEFIGSNDTEGLDNARLQPIPESSTIFLACLGLTGLGLLGRRRLTA